MQNNKIVLDTDGVILNFLKRYAECASEVLQRPITQQTNQHALDKRYGITSEEAATVWRIFGQSGNWGRLEPMEGAFEAIELLKKEKLEIHVVTAIAPEFQEQRLENFKKFGFFPASIHCTPHGPLGKIDPIAKIDPFAYVDDRLEHLHNSLHVNHLVWIDHGDEQFPEPYGRHDVAHRSLYDWTLQALEHGLDKIKSTPIANSSKESKIISKTRPSI